MPRILTDSAGDTFKDTSGMKAWVDTFPNLPPNTIRVTLGPDDVARIIHDHYERTTSGVAVYVMVPVDNQNCVVEMRPIADTMTP